MSELLATGGLEWSKIIDSLPIGLVVFNAKQEVLFGNQAYLDLLGYDILQCDGVEDWLSKMCPDPGHREKVITSWRRHVWRKQSPRTYTLKNADGKVREIEFRAALQSDGGLVMMLQDVTLIRRTEETVRLGKLKFRVLFSNLSDGVVLVDKSGRIIDVNPAFLKFLEMPLSELRLTLLSDLLHPRDAEELTKAEAELLSKEDLSKDDKLYRDIWVRTKTTEKRTRVSFCPVVSHEGEYAMGAYIFQQPDSQESLQNATAKIKQLAEKAQALLNAVPDLILLINRDKTIADFAPPAKPWKELPLSDEWIGADTGKKWPALGGLLDQAHERVFDGNKTIHAELSSSNEAGGDFVVTLAPCGENQAMAVVQNVTVIQHLKKSQLCHQVLFDHSTDGVIRADFKGTVCEVNTIACELLGRPKEDLIGMRLSQFYGETSLHADIFNRELSEHLLTKQGWVSDQTLYCPGGGEEKVKSLIIPIESDGEMQVMFNIISRKESPREKKNTLQGERGQHQIRNQLQMVTSLFALEAQDRDGQAAALKWQVRLRSLAQSYPCSEKGDVWVVAMLRSLADEVSSLSGRGPGSREIVITGPGSLVISSEISASFSLMAGEIMRMVMLNSGTQSGPKLFLDLERCAHGEISLSAKPGSSGYLFTPAQQSEAETLEILAQQLRGELRASLNEKNVGSLQVIFDGQISN